MESLAQTLLPVDLRSLALPLVLLAAYRAGAQSSLATWAAVSHLPAAPLPETPEDAKRLKRKRIRRAVLAVLACLVLYTTELGLIFGTESEKAASVFFNILVGGLMTTAYFSTFAYSFGLPRAAWNHESGRLLVRLHCPTRSAKLKAVLVGLLSLAMASATVLLPANAMLHVAGTGALTFSMVSKPAGRVTGVRRLTIFFCAYEAAVIALTVALVWMAPSNEKPTSIIGENGIKTGTTNDDVSPEELAKMMPTGVMTFLSHVIPAFYAAPVGYYIAACLRFDWHHAQSQSQPGESASILALEQLPARTGCACARQSSNSRPTTSSGLRIPSRISLAAIPLKYFTTTTIVATLLLCTISPLLNYTFKTYVFPAVTSLPGAVDGAEKVQMAQQYYEAQTFGMFAMFVTIPISCIAVAIQAASSGERKALWSYKEIWYGKGAGKQPIALTGDAELGAKDPVIVVLEKPEIIIEDFDAGEETHLITLEEAIKS